MCRKNPPVTGAIFVGHLLCLLPLFLTRTYKGGRDSWSLRIGKVIQRYVSGVGLWDFHDRVKQQYFAPQLGVLLRN